MKHNCNKLDLRNIVASKYIYKGYILNLRVDDVKFPSGDVRAREVIEHKPAVAVLPVDSDGGIYLISSYRHAVDEYLYEIPAGLIEDGETPEETAVRELQEEIGFKPGRMEHICTLYSSPGFTTEKIFLYLATELVKSPLPQDDDEYIEAFKFSQNEISEMMRDGRIKDGKTMMTMYWYRDSLGTRRAPV